MNHIRILGKPRLNLPIENILLFVANINYTIIHTIDGKQFLSSRTLKLYETKLPQFIRANKKELLNKNHIEPTQNPSIVRLSNGNEVLISRRRRELFQDLKTI